MDRCLKCGESLTYVKTVRSRKLKKRWDIFKCEKCKTIVRSVK